MNSHDVLGMLHTEMVNPDTLSIDTCDTSGILRSINALDQTVPMKVAQAIPDIAKAVDYIVERFADGGRLVYVGAGTSGRIAIMDAAECPPTYGVADDRITAVIAGGHGAIVKANEGAEDNAEAAAADLRQFGLTQHDVVMAIASSGRTPYCIGALNYAAEIGAGTVSLACNLDAAISGHADQSIEVDTGAEAIMGSTRMKGGTAQKLVLNMISTAVMIKSGKVFRNLMVNIQGSNEKLHSRISHIVMTATGLSEEEVSSLLLQADHDPKLAIVMALGGGDRQRAADLLEQQGGHVRLALDTLR